MDDDRISASRVVDALPETVFAALADPSTHASIDGTGWVTESADKQLLTGAGQVFRMAMFHANHPDGNYVTANQVEVFDRPKAISWRTGYDADDGTLRFGGWFWRYDLAATGEARTTVTLTYDWSAASQDVRDRIGFPPFGVEHLSNSLDHLAAMLEQ